MRFLKTLLCGLPLLLVAAQPVRAQELTEYNVKAAMLVKFIPYIEWPVSNTSDNFCIVGGNPFGDAVAVLKASKMNVVARSASALSDCKVAFFVGGLSPATVPEGVLTVGEDDEFADKGGMIGFKLVDNKVRFEINRSAANAAGFKVDARLLELAIKVVR
jgi:hypothetical protein